MAGGPAGRVPAGETRGGTRRRLAGTLGGATAGLVALVAAGCQVGGPGGLARAVPTVGPSALRFTYWNASPDEVQVQERVIATFQQRLPQVRVENAGDAANTDVYMEKLFTQAAAGTAPDVARIAANDMPRFARAGALLAIDPLIEREKYPLDDFWPAVLPLTEYRQKRYTFQVIGGPQPLFWNGRLFREAGVAPATELDARGDWTWERFADVARRLTRRDGDAWQVAGFPTDFTWGGVGPWVWSAGGDYFNAARTRCAIAEPAALEGVQFALDLLARHRVGPLPGEAAPGIQWFPGATVGMQVGAITTAYQWKRDPSFEFDVVLHPKGRGGQIGRLGSNGYGIMAGTKATDASWELLKHLAGPETLAYLAALGRSFPWRKSVAQSKEYRESQPVKNLDVLFKLADKNGRVSPSVPAWSEIERFANPLLRDVATGKAALRDALENVRVEADRLLAQQP